MHTISYWRAWDIPSCDQKPVLLSIQYTKFQNMFLGHFLPKEHLLCVCLSHSFCSIRPKISRPFSNSIVLSVLFTLTPCLYQQILLYPMFSLFGLIELPWHCRHCPSKTPHDGFAFMAPLLCFIPTELQLAEAHFTKSLSVHFCAHRVVSVHWSKNILLPSPSPPSPVTGNEVLMSQALARLLLPMEDGSTKLLN